MLEEIYKYLQIICVLYEILDLKRLFISLDSLNYKCFTNDIKISCGCPKRK